MWTSGGRWVEKTNDGVGARVGFRRVEEQVRKWGAYLGRPMAIAEFLLLLVLGHLGEATGRGLLVVVHLSWSEKGKAFYRWR